MVERNGEDQHGKMLLGKPASQRGELYCPNKGKKRKEMPMDGGETINSGYHEASVWKGETG
jgi:hypothetical protein